MDIATARVEPHEIAKNEDFEFGFESVIRNIAILDRALALATVDYVAGGVVRPIEGTMTFSVDALWANGKDMAFPAYRNTKSDPIEVSAPKQYPRYDIVQVRGNLEDFDSQKRAFYESELELGLFHNINTKRRLIAEIEVIEGRENNVYAPQTREGYIKLAEIYVEPGTTEITQENIRNITAKSQESENEEWRSEKDRTFIIAGIHELFDSFEREHNGDGSHRKEVIKARNILLGTKEDALTGSLISLGKNLNSEDLKLLPNMKLLEAFTEIGEILHGDKPQTLLKNLSMLLEWKSDEVYQSYRPAFFKGKVYSANPDNLPGKGQSPENHPQKWILAGMDEVQIGELPTGAENSKTDSEGNGAATEGEGVFSHKDEETGALVFKRIIAGKGINLEGSDEDKIVINIKGAANIGLYEEPETPDEEQD